MWALVFTAGVCVTPCVVVVPRTLPVIDGCEAAWVFFGGVFKVLVPDNWRRW
ncbi:MAG: hypothetical protein IPN02_00400 [Candidatus Microthrix sp.]|uniref:Uncharacterized protein n=1 Tax=Candidatus Neomicrothrix subdominans TaxID=2954438 RepID=A0A936TCT1_9ACTN|nr:hypothetical protein [Candidatus Microthrix subdominans]